MILLNLQLVYSFWVSYRFPAFSKHVTATAVKLLAVAKKIAKPVHQLFGLKQVSSATALRSEKQSSCHRRLRSALHVARSSSCHPEILRRIRVCHHWSRWIFWLAYRHCRWSVQKCRKCRNNSCGYQSQCRYLLLLTAVVGFVTASSLYSSNLRILSTWANLPRISG